MPQIEQTIDRMRTIATVIELGCDGDELKLYRTITIGDAQIFMSDLAEIDAILEGVTHFDPDTAAEEIELLERRSKLAW